MSSRLQRGDRLKQLRESRLSKGKPKRQEDVDLYDEVDEEDAQQDEDFVVDDDNAGYIDNGVDDQHFSDEYEQDPDQSKHGKRKRKSTKKEKVKEKESTVAKPNQQINRFFNNSTLKAAMKPKAAPIDEQESEDFMKDLLSSFDTGKPSVNMTKNSFMTKKPIVKGRPRTFTKPVRFEDDDVDIFVKDEPVPETLPVENDDPMDGGDDMFDDDIVFDDEFLKKEVAGLTIADPLKPNFLTVNKNAPRPDLQSWKAAEASVVDTFNQDEIRIDAKQMDIFESDGHLKMWWYDAYERKEKGYVYVFGKVLNKQTKKYVSCCVTVKNIERNLFVLPRRYELDASGAETTTPVDMADVYSEISDLCSKYRIKKFASKEVVRKYAFELKDVPAESSYLKVLYDYEQPAFSGGESGRTFSHIFGATTGPLEHFLTKRDIMGPCWLDITDAKFSSTSETWCKLEISVDDPKTVNPVMDASGNRPLEVPPLVVLSLSLRTILNEKKNVNEIVAFSALVCDQVMIDDTKPLDLQSKMRFTAVRQLDNTPYPASFLEAVAKEKKENGLIIQTDRTETALLNYLIARIHMCDPDIIVGHNFAGFDLDVLLHRMKALRVQHWHRLGRLKRTNWPKLQAGAGGAGDSTYQEKLIMSGRLVCDTYLASKDLIRSKSYRMTDLAQSQLKIAREDIEFGKTAEYFENAESLIHLLKHCSFDAFLASALMFKLQILPLTHQLTNLAGNLWSRTLTGARAERNEFLLLHEFHKAKYICPEKSFGAPKTAVVVQAAERDGDEEAVAMATDNNKKKAGSGKRKPAYAGGLVLEPKKGFYDKYVMLLDFNSLYPSIIQEYNVCFTTVDRSKFVEGTGENGEEKVPEVPNEELDQGILPRLIRTLVDRRKQVKRMMNNYISEAAYMQLDIRQKALKLTANSMYGCLGFTYSRFYAKPLAMLITHKGREILQSTVNLAGHLEMNVIYGDTDSIMVYTNSTDLEEVKKMGSKLRKSVNERYKLLEIGIDGYYKHLLLLKKKKYAALLVEEKAGQLVETIETKGLDLVRRDWCDLSHDVSSHVLDLILSDKEREDVINEIHLYLEVVAEKIRQGEIPLEKYTINKQLTKKPQDYADAKTQPHVQVALRMLKSGRNAKNGDMVPYVICKVNEETSGDKKGAALRAYHPDDVVKQGMQLDIEWYLYQQVHPPLTRLCSPIEGTDPARLAECLGLDTKRYNFNIGQSDNSVEFVTLDSQTSDSERFKACDKLLLNCRCGEKGIEYTGIVRKIDEQTIQCGLDCPKCKKTIPVASLKVQAQLAARSYIKRYYDNWYVCDDITCGNRTRLLSVFGRRCVVHSCRGYVKREYSDKQLYTQLLYLSMVFDPVKAKSIKWTGQALIQSEILINRHYRTLLAVYQTVQKHLDRSGYRHVDLSKLLSQINLS
ncbi:hypothetical protein INT47_001922 [Mucor saturninus]|uniref:DNA polymerase n=1 Tax=Mucor saturninus TaxID=64648 RepID=A0A8H7RE65_9FUNG|nr:hypothetical protein INT47_001922 [Mucor saturninus]